MAVPTTGSFLMFGTGSNVTIAGAIIEGGANAETVSSTLNFNALKGLADINKFDAEFKEGATTLEEIIKTIQFRGYPTTGSITTTTTTTLAPAGCYQWKLECFGPTGCLAVWTDCNGNNQSISIAGDNSGSICARPTPTISSGSVTLLGNCPTTTTTTISPTTTTTTAGPCSLTLYFNVAASPSPGGWDTQTEACEGTGTPLTVYFSGSTCPTTFNEAFNDGKALYTNISLTTLLDGNDKWFKDTSSPNSGQAIQIGSGGFINQIGVCITTTTTTTTTTASPTTTTTTAAPTTTTTTTEGPLYYTLNSCNPGDPLYDTTITPLLANQRYVDPISGNFWVWDNAAGTSSPQQTVNNSLQIVSGQSGCP